MEVKLSGFTPKFEAPLCAPCVAPRTGAPSAPPTRSDVAGVALAGSMAAGLPWPLVLLFAALYLGGRRGEASS